MSHRRSLLEQRRVFSHSGPAGNIERHITPPRGRSGERIFDGVVHSDTDNTSTFITTKPPFECSVSRFFFCVVVVAGGQHDVDGGRVEEDLRRGGRAGEAVRHGERQPSFAGVCVWISFVICWTGNETSGVRLPFRPVVVDPILPLSPWSMMMCTIESLLPSAVPLRPRSCPFQGGRRRGMYRYMTS